MEVLLCVKSRMAAPFFTSSSLVQLSYGLYTGTVLVAAVCCHRFFALGSGAFGSRRTVFSTLVVACSCFLCPSKAFSISPILVSNTIPAWTISSMIACT